MNDKTDYYIECVECSLCDNGFEKEYSAEQIADIANHVGADVAAASEHYDQAFGYDVADANLRGDKERELKKLKEQLEKEKNAVFCERCNGTGQIRIDGPCHYSMSDCYKCKGKGKIYD